MKRHRVRPHDRLQLRARIGNAWEGIPHLIQVALLVLPRESVQGRKVERAWVRHARVVDDSDGLIAGHAYSLAPCGHRVLARDRVSEAVGANVPENLRTNVHARG